MNQRELKSKFAYCPDTGLFTRIAGHLGVGKVARSKDSKGYIQISISGVLYLAHRLAWLYMSGEWPSFEIDHINGVSDDNRWPNLRRADRFINCQNSRRASRNNKTGFLGVTKRGHDFLAHICVERKKRMLGRYRTPEDAYAAYVKAKRELHPGNTL